MITSDRQDDGLCEAFQPFADFMARPSFDKLPDNMQITSGSPMAGRQLTVGDLRKLALTIATPPTREAAEGAGEPSHRYMTAEQIATDKGIIRAAPSKPAPDAMREAKRYRRLQVIGCAPDGTTYLKNGTVLRFSNLDAFLDVDIEAHPSRGDVPLSAPVLPAEGATPAGVYFSTEMDNFYFSTGKGCGNEFFARWKSRWREFPQSNVALSPSPAVAAEPVAWEWRHRAAHPGAPWSKWRHVENIDGFRIIWESQMCGDPTKSAVELRSLYAAAPVRGDREAFYRILSRSIPSDMIDGIWQELKEAGVA